MAAAWNFESRTVTFSVSLSVTFDSHARGATISFPWLDASGSLSAATNFGPLATLAPETQDDGEEAVGPQLAQTTQELGSLAVTWEMVQAIRKVALPITVQESGQEENDQIKTIGQVHLAPLLMACEDITEEAAWKRPRHPSEVIAVITQDVEVKGLTGLEIKLNTNIPILSSEMLNYLMPLCMTIDMVKNLPNEQWLTEQCKDVYLDISPLFSRATEILEDGLPSTVSISRSHRTSIKFSEPIVWFLGLLPEHAVREWMQHEGIVVEIHDRDVRDASSEKTDNEEPPEVLKAKKNRERHCGKRVPHPHGVAFFQLRSMLQSRSLRERMRADVCPARSDKKQRRAEALSEGLCATGLLSEEGSKKIAERLGLDKREDTTEYHEHGTVCTMRVSLASPFPSATEVQSREEEQHNDRWAAKEVAGEDGVFEAKADEADPQLHYAPRSMPFRAKGTAPDGAEICGPWRKNRSHALSDHQQLQEACGANASFGGQENNVHFRYERFGRLILVVAETDLGTISSVIAHVAKVNAKVKGLDPASGEFATCQLTEMEKTDPNFDILTGFCILDGSNRIFVLEGLRDGEMKALAETIDAGERACTGSWKVLYNPDIGYGNRLYGEFGMLKLPQIKIRVPLEKLALKPNVYLLSGLEGDEAPAVNNAIKLLMNFKHMKWQRAVRSRPLFPDVWNLKQLQILYGGFLSDAEMEGRSIYTSPKSRGRTLRRSTPLQQDNVDGNITLKHGEGGKAGRSAYQVKRKAPTEARNLEWNDTIKLRSSASAPDLTQVNKHIVRQQSEKMAKLNVELGVSRTVKRETPFLDGQQVYIYSQQRHNCTEKQKAWMREKMDPQQREKMWSYSEHYLTQDFQFSGAKPPGIHGVDEKCPNDTYANIPGDNRQPWRGVVKARPKEEFRKPPRDIDTARADELHQAFNENEWHRLPVGEERRKPIAAHRSYDPERIPHQRIVTERPFDATRMQPEARPFGPKSSNESVHFDGRIPGEDVYAEIERYNIREQSRERGKIIHKQPFMRTFSQVATRHCINDGDRYEHICKERPVKQLRGQVDHVLPVGIKHHEKYHEIGHPAKEWHARLRENDAAPPYDVMTGKYLVRDPDVDAKLKRAVNSGTLGKAPWRHGARPLHETQKSAAYQSVKDFNVTKPLARPSDESHVWKCPNRHLIPEPDHREKLPYLQRVQSAI